MEKVYPNERIIYPNPDGSVSVVIPTTDLPVEEVAKKDVPADTPYLIVTDVDLPSNRYFRNAWEADFSEPHGYGMGADAWFAANPPPETAFNQRPDDVPTQQEETP